ncbi:MAG: DUF2971 domain-containing protein [Rhodobacter sp.]|nr:DUF2971 domain-containing protein [Rhodobacter sp.]
MRSTASLMRPFHNQGSLSELLTDAFFKNTPDPSPEHRFVYYTNADTAVKIIQNEEVWLRNALVMNDYTEIIYGLESIRNALFEEGDASGVFAAVEDVFGSMAVDHVRQRLRSELREKDWFWQLETYLACLSQHDDSEDRTGRLSMWRAYGDVAIVMNGAPFAAPSSGLNAPYSAPVLYLDRDKYGSRLSKVAKTLRDYAHVLRTNRQINPESMVDAFAWLAYSVAIRAKHPGFSEERELRVVFHSPEKPNPRMVQKQAVINGVAQTVWALQLVHDPANGLTGANLPSLLEKIIIGPTAQPKVSYDAFVQLLAKANVPDAFRKVIVSDIPLRAGSLGSAKAPS